LPLPLATAKATTAGKNVPTGDQCWTLLLNTGNFKGPVAFFTPCFWSRPTINEPHLAGMFLDARPSAPNRALQMETQYVPAVQASDAKGETYARIAKTFFPAGAGDDSPLVHRITSYNKKALWDAVKTWFEGGAAASGAINEDGAVMHNFSGRGGATWKIYGADVAKEQRAQVAWSSFATPVALDANTFGYRWNRQLAAQSDSPHGPLISLPEYYRLATNARQKAEWVPVSAAEVPAETGLMQFAFRRPRKARAEPYVTPEEPASCWKKPGPAAGPFRARLGDGSTVTYYWYRFADQPAMLNADLTDKEREAMQARVESIHRRWSKDRDYLPPPKLGKLADLDPALLVTPPKGLEAGYVPIVTRQAAEE
jgi:hypothetical protein